MTNETVLTAAMVALGGLRLSPIAVTAQSWPAKSIRVIVPWPGGRSTDAAARPVAQKMSEYLGVPMVIENRAGAAGTIGAEVVARPVKTARMRKDFERHAVLVKSIGPQAQ